MFLILRSMRTRVRYKRDRLKKVARDLVLDKLVESRVMHKIPILAYLEI